MSAQRIPGDVPAAVRNLLISTKQLQQSIRQWSIGQASETQVSDIFVQIGTDFNTTIHAFAYHNIDLRSVPANPSIAQMNDLVVSDIHSVPQELREVLEQCLAEDPSPQALAIYMTDLRQVLFKLLKGLQLRQEAWRVAGGQLPKTPPDSR